MAAVPHDDHHSHRPTFGAHRGAHHGPMSGPIVGQYDLLVGRLLMSESYRRIAAAVTRDVPRDGSLLDVGTGPGRLPAEVVRIRPDLVVTGVDPSADMLVRAAANARGARFVQASAEALPLEDGSQDAVVSSLASHHWADTHRAVAEHARILRPGGRLWVVDGKNRLDPALPGLLAGAGLRPTDERIRFGWLTGLRLRTVVAIKP